MTALDVYARARELGLDLELESDLNFLNFYAEELRAGQFLALQPLIRQKMRRLGFVSHSYGCRFIITPKAAKLLGEKI